MRAASRGKQRYAQAVHASRKDAPANRLATVGVYFDNRSVNEHAERQGLTLAELNGACSSTRRPSTPLRVASKQRLFCAAS